MRKFLSNSFILFILILNSCDKKQENALTQFSWLTGEWMDSTSDGKTIEMWSKINDSIYVGNNIYLQGADTIFYEEISIKIIKDSLYYIPSVRSQNEGKEIYFAMTSSKKREFVFENKSHDFPQKIVYTNPEKDSLVAYIEGPSENGVRREYFRMKRVR